MNYVIWLDPHLSVYKITKFQVTKNIGWNSINNLHTKVNLFQIFNSLMNSANSNSYFFLPSSSSSKTFFLNFAFGLLPNGMNDINVRYVRKMSEKCQKCQWVYTSVRVCTSVRCFAQLCPGVSKWAYVCACVCGMNFQNTFWRLDS